MTVDKTITLTLISMGETVMSLYDQIRHKQVRQGMMASRNELLRKLERNQGGQGRYMKGASLIGSELSNTYMRSLLNQSHPRAFWSAFTEKSVKAVATVCLDVSGSMTSKLDPDTEGKNKREIERMKRASYASRDTYYTETVYAVSVVKEIFASMGIPFMAALGEYDYAYSYADGSTTDYKHTPKIICGFNDREINREKMNRLLDYDPSTGTDIKGYFQVAVDMLSQRQEEIKLAFIMTDGCCPQEDVERVIMYQKICEVKGITLIPIVFGQVTSRIPNEIRVNNAIDFGSTFIKKLVSILP